MRPPTVPRPPTPSASRIHSRRARPLGTAAGLRAGSSDALSASGSLRSGRAKPSAPASDSLRSGRAKPSAPAPGSLRSGCAKPSAPASGSLRSGCAKPSAPASGSLRSGCAKPSASRRAGPTTSSETCTSRWRAHAPTRSAATPGAIHHVSRAGSAPAAAMATAARTAPATTPQRVDHRATRPTSAPSPSVTMMAPTTSTGLSAVPSVVLAQSLTGPGVRSMNRVATAMMGDAAGATMEMKCPAPSPAPVASTPLSTARPRGTPSARCVAIATAARSHAVLARLLTHS